MKKKQKESLKKAYGISFKRVYDSLEVLPMHNWLKCREENDFSFLVRSAKMHRKPLNKYATRKLYSVYLDLITEFFAEFGQPKSYANELMIIKDLTRAKLEYAQTGDEFLFNSIEVLEKRLQEMKLKNREKELGTNDKEEMKRAIAAVSSSIGGFTDLKKVTVHQFYTQLKGISKR